MVGKAGDVLAVRIPIRNLAVAATDNGRLAPGTAAGIGRGKRPAMLLCCGLRRSQAAALTIGHVERWDGRRCIVDGARAAGARGVSRPAGRPPGIVRSGARSPWASSRRSERQKNI
jgi:hypothetical protein